MPRASSGVHPSTKGKSVTLPMHPELHKAIRLAALSQDLNYAEWMHLHFAEFFGRSDLPLTDVDLTRNVCRAAYRREGKE